MQPNRKEALAFVKALTGNEETECTFQTFCDKSAEKDKEENRWLSQIFHGTLDENYDDLAHYNECGAGVFITVNETDLQGRKRGNMVKPRALFVDSDTGEIRVNGGLGPNIRVQSKHGEHAYWLLGSEGGDSFSGFRESQLNLADFLQTDPSVKDTSRVMRLPGFYHMKESPFYVYHKHLHSKRHTMNEVVDSFRGTSTKYGLGALRLACAAVRASTHPGRHETLIKEAAGLCGLVKGKELDESEARSHLESAFADCIGDDRPWVTEFQEAWKWGMDEAEPRYRENPQLTPDDNNDEPLEIHDISDAMMQDIHAMRDMQGNAYLYEEGKWVPSSKLVLESMSRKYERNRYHTKKSRREHIVDDMLSTPGVQQYEKIEWNVIPRTYVPLKGGLLDIISGKLHDHKPEHMLDKYLPVDYDPDAYSERWNHCLDMWFGGDKDGEQKIAALQEFFGYIILNHALYKKFLMLFGHSNTGKSAIAGVMADMVSRENICQIKVSKLGDSRALAPIQGKMLNMITDLSEHDNIDDGGIKRLASTEEWIEIDAKYSKPIVYKPTCKHVFITNSLPGINDKTSATFNRILMIECINEIPEHLRDDELGEKLKKDLSGILNWAIDGARRLADSHGVFTNISSSEELLEEYRQQQNPFMTYLEEMCEVTHVETDRVPYRDLLNSYNEWRCPPGKATGNKPCGERSFTDHLRAQRFKTKKSNSVYYVLGLKMKDPFSLG